MLQYLIVNVRPLFFFFFFFFWGGGLLIVNSILDSLVAICLERLSRQLFTVLILNADLVVLVPLLFCPCPVWCLGRYVELDCIGS